MIKTEVSEIWVFFKSKTVDWGDVTITDLLENRLKGQIHIVSCLSKKLLIMGLDVG